MTDTNNKKKIQVSLTDEYSPENYAKALIWAKHNKINESKISASKGSDKNSKNEKGDNEKKSERKIQIVDIVLILCLIVIIGFCVWYWYKNRNKTSTEREKIVTNSNELNQTPSDIRPGIN